MQQNCDQKTRSLAVDVRMLNETVNVITHETSVCRRGGGKWWRGRKRVDDTTNQTTENPSIDFKRE